MNHIEDHEQIRQDRLVAALCHFSALLPLVGIAVPLSIWLSQRERSPLLRFQALQALSYQLLGLLVYIGMSVVQFVGSFAFFPLAVIPVALSEVLPPEVSMLLLAMMMLLVVLFSVILALLNMLVCVLGPVFLAIAVWGSWRVLAGHNYHYPILGRLLEKKVAS